MQHTTAKLQLVLLAGILVVTLQFCGGNSPLNFQGNNFNQLSQQTSLDPKPITHLSTFSNVRSSLPLLSLYGVHLSGYQARKQKTVSVPLADVSKVETEGVDVVYLWVNGSDPGHQARLQQWQDVFTAHAWKKKGQQATLKARFNADRDELKFSLRSLEWCMPWFRHLYIVTNGQVPTWLNIDNPRVTVVPELSIFENAEDLPTFNSNAVEANLHRIPGISDTYIMMNDDFFFTKPWSLKDFLTEDGSEVLLFNIHPIHTCRPGEQCEKAATLHMEALMHVDKLLLKYSSAKRFKPAHAPQLIQKHIMQFVQQDFPKSFRATVSHKFRSSTDMHVVATYKWFMEANQPGHQLANTSRARIVYLKDKLANNNAAYKTLLKAWMQPGTKSLCINDDTSNVELLPIINEQVARFLKDQYPVPSEFELPEGVVNGCTKWLTASYGQLPSKEEIAAACGGSNAQPIA